MEYTNVADENKSLKERTKLFAISAMVDYIVRPSLEMF